MQALDPAGVYSDSDVLRELRAVDGSRLLDFRYERLSSANVLLGEITSVQSASIALNALAEIKRTAKFSLQDVGGIDFLKDRIKPYARLAMPGGGFVEWPLGVFLLSTPTRRLTAAGHILRDVEAYDQLAALRDDIADDRLTYNPGTVVTTKLATIMDNRGIAYNITPSTRTLGRFMEWEPGTTFLRIVNDLLDVINYESAAFDEHGHFVAKPYLVPSKRPVEYVYASDAVSVISGDVTQTVDLFDIPNKWMLLISEADAPSIRSVYFNTSPSSPTSTVSRGRTIATFHKEEDAVDQATLDAKAERMAAEASQVFESLEFETAIMPIHSTGDVVAVRLPELAVDASFAEQSWEYDLQAGTLMKHKVRRVVDIS